MFRILKSMSTFKFCLNLCFCNHVKILFKQSSVGLPQMCAHTNLLCLTPGRRLTVTFAPTACQRRQQRSSGVNHWSQINFLIVSLPYIGIVCIAFPLSLRSLNYFGTIFSRQIPPPSAKFSTSYVLLLYN